MSDIWKAAAICVAHGTMDGIDVPGCMRDALNEIERLRDALERAINEKEYAEVAQRTLSRRIEELENRGTCEWMRDDDSEWYVWETQCGETWHFDDGGPNENRMKFCPGCGRALVVVEAFLDAKL
jgi:tRNA(Met) C34 N-acetyltransferase TmcA